MQEVLGVTGQNNLIKQTIPAIGIISSATFRTRDPKNAPVFTAAASTVGRLGVFAAKKGDSERAVILLLPASAKPDRVLIAITHGFGGNAAEYYGGLGWSNSLSPKLIQDVLLRFVVNRWGAQTLAGRKNMALLLIVRANNGTSELGPFASDGPFVDEVLSNLVSLTGNAFSYDHVEAFTYSSGIGDLNPFLSAVNPVLNVEVVYGIDPAPAIPVQAGPSALRKQYLSGMTKGSLAAAEFMPLQRWRNEDSFDQWQRMGMFDYLHNLCMPRYVLHLGIQTS
jgi:hypothetical protein